MKKILIVDDEEIILRLTENVLKDKYETLLASSGEEAIRVFDECLPDLVLSDLQMPSMSGYDLQSIVHTEIDPAIPFIFMTADESDDSESMGLEQGAADYIRKPVKAALLIKRIERVLDNVDENRRLKAAAQIDAMTGLLNKAAAESVLNGICLKKKGTLLALDLDSFKLVNDLYGHDMGDRILIRFAELIKSVIRKEDIAGRIGGDEFIVFCENLTNQSVIAEKVEFLNNEINKSASEFVGKDIEIPLGCSGGAVEVPENGESYLKLFVKADSALYRTKQNGKHGCSFYEEESEKTSVSNVSSFDNLRIIFNERNMGRGALNADNDSFRTIYRFLNRFLSNYQWDIRMVMFTIVTDDENINEITDKFIELASTKLRGSDVILKFNKNQVIMLFMKVNDENYTIPILRVLGAWDKDGIPGVEITYEAESIDGRDRGDDVDNEITEQVKREEEKLPKWFFHEPLIDIHEGLKNAVTADSYLSSVDIFLEYVENNIEELQKYIDENDITNYKIKVHGIKSTSRIIGAMRLSMMAASLERAGVDNNFKFIKSQHKAFIDEYRLYAKVLTEHMYPGTKEKISEEKLMDAMTALKEFSRAEDFSLVEMTLDSLKMYELPPAEGEKIAELKHCLLNLDWDRIHKLL
ncbi:diguanylate cyclase domain-containing protein [Butyrivibrio sp. AE3004]|uniref:diguanylate cyclase domain-containing protein n=1 Tax=Butyrivibrio sp. AE3004 TaxID=1506994 RepID=UPI0004945C6D|nr:diguanylate cyclase [Butyrivibrio sp. AE3004]